MDSLLQQRYSDGHILFSLIIHHVSFILFDLLDASRIKIRDFIHGHIFINFLDCCINLDNFPHRIKFTSVEGTAMHETEEKFIAIGISTTIYLFRF